MLKKCPLFSKAECDRSLLLLSLLALFGSIVTIVWLGVLYYQDSMSYVEAWDNSLAFGRLDACRTAAYPLLLGVLKWVFGVHFDWATICIQHIVFLFSIRYFYRLASMVVVSRKWVFGLTLLYIISFIRWHSVIQTESLSCSGMVFLLYVVYKLNTDFSAGKAVLSLLLLVWLLLLRPASIYLLPVLFVWWLVAAFKGKAHKPALYGIGVVAIASLCMLGYMRAFEKEYGRFTTSNIGLYNQLYIAFDRKLIQLDVIGTDSIRNDVAACIERFDVPYGSYATVDYLLEKYDPQLLWKMVKDSYKSQPLNYTMRTLEQMRLAKSNGLFIAAHPNLAAMLDLLGVNVGSFYLFLVFYTVLLLIWVFKNKTVPLHTSLLYMLGISHFVVVVLGAQNDWKRLLMASFPVYLLMFGQLCAMLRFVSPTRLD